MDRGEFYSLVTNQLDRGDDRCSTESGAVLYSDLASVRPGRFYLLGINPGGEDGPRMPKICEALCAPDGTNSYADQCWACTSAPCAHIDSATGRLRPEARSKMQKRVCDLIDALGVPPRDVFSTNLAFARSPELSQLRAANEWFRRCWPVHQALMRVVRPAWIVMLGYGDAYEFIRRSGSKIGEQEPIQPGSRAAWHQRLALDIGECAAYEVRVLAVAHPSVRGFNAAGLGGADRYPDELRAFITAEVLGGRA